MHGRKDVEARRYKPGLRERLVKFVQEAMLRRQLWTGSDVLFRLPDAGASLTLRFVSEWKQALGRGRGIFTGVIEWVQEDRFSLSEVAGVHVLVFPFCERKHGFRLALCA